MYTLARFASICFLSISFANAQTPRSYASSELLLQLKKLNTVGSVLYIAAHPDDENTRLISYLANEQCVRTGYLSLTRGDGGQNLIGSEQGVELGLIRAQELVAARRTDGGEQFFTRAYDFGFSKSPEETLHKWQRDSILSDMVWVIRQFRPDVIITRFATDGSGGHGHHTTSAILAEEAFEAAADPKRFPEQLEKVTVWKPRRLLHNSTARFFNPNADLSHLMKLDVGKFNPMLGKSYGEISAESRSMHKSQGFGSARQRGEYFEYFKPLKGDTTGLKDPFQGIDFTWQRIPGGAAVGKAITQIMNQFVVAHPEASLPALAKVHAQVLKLNHPDLLYKRKQLEQLMVWCSGISVDVTSSQTVITSGSKQKLEFSVVARNPVRVKLKGIAFPGLWRNQSMPFDTLLDTLVKTNLPVVISFASQTSSSQEVSQPYFLRKPIHDGMFDVAGLDYRVLPEYSTHNQALLRCEIEGIPLQLPLTIQYKWVDPEKGELYRPVVLAPPITVSSEEDVLVFGDMQSKKLKLYLKANRDSASAEVTINVPSGWDVSSVSPALQSTLNGSNNRIFAIKLAKRNDVQELELNIKPIANAPSSSLSISLLIDGQKWNLGMKEIQYDHIPVQTYFTEARVKLMKLDVKHAAKRIGYIPGAGDEVQACLTQLGYEVVTLTNEKLASDDLKQYDAIITGVRAYNTNDKLPVYKRKLMEYVSNGGNLIVQYNTNSWAGPLSSDIGPYPFKINRNRITDEQAKVVRAIPDHPVFSTPNVISDEDFSGWIQERSIYHASDWDSNYVAPISMADPYEMTVGNVSPVGKPDKGALIIGRHGKGHFVYTGLVFFRQLPAGVPGAYRFMVNLIELGK